MQRTRRSARHRRPVQVETHRQISFCISSRVFNKKVGGGVMMRLDGAISLHMKHF